MSSNLTKRFSWLAVLGSILLISLSILLLPQAQAAKKEEEVKPQHLKKISSAVSISVVVMGKLSM